MTQQIRKRYVDPIRYEVGKDISIEKYQEALTKIADWFVEWRNTKEPAALVKQLFHECLDGVTADGKPWFAAANSTLAARLRVKCRYDIDKMVPLRSAKEKTKEKKAKEKQKQLLKRAAERADPLLPDELRKQVQKQTKYGDDPVNHMTSAEQRMWERTYKDYVSQHPELSGVSSSEELKMLCDTHVMMERFRMQTLSGKSVNQLDVEAMVKRFTNLKKSLGIHPDQIKKRTGDVFDASIGEAVARFQDMGDDYINLRERFWIEELIQLYQMYNTPKADGKGYQLDEVGLFGITRSKPERCPNCDTLVFGGLTIEQIEEFLIRKKAIVPLEVEAPDAEVKDGVVGGDIGSEESGLSTDRAEDRDSGTSSEHSAVAALPGSGAYRVVGDRDPTPPENDIVYPTTGDAE